MPPASEEIAQLVAELNNASRPDLINWLFKALSGEEWRLPLERDETPDIGIARIRSQLRGDTREFLKEAAMFLLREWNETRPWPLSVRWTEPRIDVLLAVVLDSSYAEDTPERLGAIDLLWKLVQDAARFDALPRYLQIRIQNTVEEHSEILPIQGWCDLVGRDPGRFGATAFGALARLSLHHALSILPDLPETPQMVEAIRMRVRWLISVLPEATRHRDLAQIAQTLVQTRPALRAGMQAAFSTCGTPLPEPSIIPRFHHVLEILQADPAPRDALNT